MDRRIGAVDEHGEWSKAAEPASTTPSGTVEALS